MFKNNHPNNHPTHFVWEPNHDGVIVGVIVGVHNNHPTNFNWKRNHNEVIVGWSAAGGFMPACSAPENRVGGRHSGGELDERCG